MQGVSDLFINFEYRHQGFGKEFFNKLIEMIDFKKVNNEQEKK